MSHVARRTAWLAILSLAVLVAPVSAQPARQGLLTLEDARIFIGTGDPIIIVHGGPGLDHAYVQPGLNALAGRNTLVYYDQRGTGRSEVALDSTSVSFDVFVDDIDMLRQVLEYERVTVLGHSFGALIALEFARRYPDSLDGLILMNPAEPGSRFADATATRMAAARTEEDVAAMAELTASEGFEARDPTTLSEVYHVAFRSTFRDRARVEELDLGLAARTAQNGQDVARLLGQSMGTVDWWDRLLDIQTPTLIVHGRNDIPPVSMARALAEALPRGSVAILQSGHFPYIEDVEALTSAISGFLAGLRR